MRSFFHTLLLAILAFIGVFISVVQIGNGNLTKIFGSPAIKIGDPIYSSFKPSEVGSLFLKSSDATATFSRKSGSWMMISPFVDRMDPRATKGIIDFTVNTRVADFFENDDKILSDKPLREGEVSIRLESDDGRSLAKYMMGRRTAWTVINDETNEVSPTVFLQLRDRNRRAYTYACTGDIRSVFNKGFSYLRDHHPFLFAPTQLEKIHIKSSSAEFLLEGSGQKADWRITKPQKIAADPIAIKNLIEGLFHLTAIRVIDRSAITLPQSKDNHYLEISIQSKSQLEPVTLNIFAPVDEKATTVLATVSDRPTAVFELLLLPQNDLIGLSELPVLNYNQLRSKNLPPVALPKMEKIVINMGNRTSVQLSLPPPRNSWFVNSDDHDLVPISELALMEFGKLINESHVEAFLTDTAFLTDEKKDLVSYGLDHPALSMTFFYQDKSSLMFKIGLLADGTVTAHVNHPETQHTIFKLPNNFISKIPIDFNQWRDTKLLSISPVDFVGFGRSLVNRPSIQLSYDYLNEKWATSGSVEPQNIINMARANKLISVISDLRVSSWLSRNDQEALEALATPSMKMNILSKTLNEFGEQAGLKQHVLEITPVTKELASQYFYGRLNSETDLFLLDRKTAMVLAADFFKEDD
jgi:Domain of unknown function (DUF4340)